uniref:Protein YIPF n=1 Tax=Steinernema glaseri TaxID=37863 RepID=A0A1I7ZDE8_9BILA
MDNLNFQDFTVNVSPPVNSSNDQRPAGWTVDSDQLITGSTGTESSATKKNFFSLDYYQQFFDVDAEDVQSRLLNSMIPRFRSNFITDYVQPIPDLYGPFWVSVTLIFTTGIFGNLAKYIQSSGASGQTFENDFGLVTGASTLIALYVIVVPFILYNVIWYRQATIQYSYLELLCAYGYSLTVFVPVSILWVIHWEWFRWSLIAVSVFLSGAVLVGSIWPSMKNDPNRLIAFGTIGSILFLHTILAVGFKEYYFDAVHLPSTGAVAKPDIPSGALPTAALDNVAPKNIQPQQPVVPNETQQKKEDTPEVKEDKRKKDQKRESLHNETQTDSKEAPAISEEQKKPESSISSS